MQTFLPLPSFEKSAECLDDLRLKKQLVEGFQILNILAGFRTGFKHHPAVLMWVHHRTSLTVYCLACLHEYEVVRENSRMKVNTKVWEDCPSLMGPALYQHIEFAFETEMQLPSSAVKPKWFGGEAFHSAHRSILLAKDYAHYSRFGWKETPAVKNDKGQFPYVWPTKITDSKK